MGAHGVEHRGVAGRGEGEGAADRFAGWSALAARLLLALLAALLLASVLVPLADPSEPATEAAAEVETPLTGEEAEERDKDLALYRMASRRIAAGENYYDFIVKEQRERNYPVRPGIAVRLPTLAWINAVLGPAGQVAAAIALMLAVIAAWWRRFGEEPGVGRLRRIATAMVFVGASLGLNRYYFPLHELWAGMLVALSFGLHRIGRGGEGGRWVAAWVAAALALAIRELALPYVLLMGAFALWNRNWKEAATWGALIVLFCAGLAWHLSLVTPHVLEGDPPSPAWLALRGLSGWLGNLSGASNLRLLPHWIAGPCVILMTLGWASLRSRLGAFGFLLALGYGIAFMIAGRWNNFYWGAVVAPAVFAGLTFAPHGLVSLAQAARIGPAVRRAAPAK